MTEHAAGCRSRLRPRWLTGVVAAILAAASCEIAAGAAFAADDLLDTSAAAIPLTTEAQQALGDNIRAAEATGAFEEVRSRPEQRWTNPLIAIGWTPPNEVFETGLI